MGLEVVREERLTVGVESCDVYGVEDGVEGEVALLGGQEQHLGQHVRQVRHPRVVIAVTETHWKKKMTGESSALWVEVERERGGGGEGGGR